MARKSKGPSAQDIEAAVELVLDSDDPQNFGEDGYPLLVPVAEAGGFGLDTMTDEMVRAASDAVWAKREDAGGADPAEPEAGGEDARDGGGSGREAAAVTAPLPSARPDVVKATREIIEAGEPLERGAPALWALRDAVEGSVSKADAAAAYQEETGKPWPWPPTAAELKDAAEGRRRFPAAMYHAKERSITVADEAAEARAKKNGYKRAREMKPEALSAAIARDAAATPPGQ